MKCSSVNILCKGKLDNAACEDRTCDNATTKTSYAECNKWLSTCTWNKKSDGTAACVAIKDKCNE